MKQHRLSIVPFMPRKLHKHKILLDENMPPRQRLPYLNCRFDVKHISKDFKKGGIEDSKVYQEAVKQRRVIVTLNGNDFRDLATLSMQTGIIGVSENLTYEQLDKKLTSLFIRSTPKALRGKFRYISGETL